jgi:hypothetical protein
MTADPYTLTLQQGKTFRVGFQVKNSSGVATPLTGWGARFVILDKPNGIAKVTVDQTILDPITPFDPCVVIEPGSVVGLIHVRLGADQTKDLVKSCCYDASVYNLTDLTEVQPLSSGIMVVLKMGAEP